MKIRIENVAMIESAEIDVDGLTVIAGENNTGKSTVGKVIFSLFNGLCDISDKINTERQNEIYNAIYRSADSGNIRRMMVPRRYFLEEIQRIIDEKLGKEDISKTLELLINKAPKRLTEEPIEINIENIANRIEEIVRVEDENVARYIINEYFLEVFGGQLSPLYDENINSHIMMNIRDNEVKLDFVHNRLVNLQDEVNIIHPAYYIDDPLTISDGAVYSDGEITRNHLRRALFSGDWNMPEDESIAKVLANDKVKNVLELLKNAIPGEFVKEGDGGKFIQEGFFAPIDFNNLSMGFKSFMIMRLMLEKNIIKDQDVLILDEPEIHLHPEWQLIYAEAIVLLQKAFNLSIILTTHSPYFLRAIQIFSQKHGVNDKCRYYASESHGNKAQISDVTDNIEIIFNKLARPLQKLEDLRWSENE